MRSGLTGHKPTSRLSEHRAAYCGSAGPPRCQIDAEYHALGIDHFILSGQPHLEEAYYFAEGAAAELRQRGLLQAPAALQGS